MKVSLVIVFACTVAAQMVPELYGWSCVQLGLRRDWGEPPGLSMQEKKMFLCKNVPEYVEYLQQCAKIAVQNATDPEKAYELAERKSLCPIELNPNIHTSSDSSRKKVLNLNEAKPELALADPTDAAELFAALETAKWRYETDALGMRYGIALLIYWMGVLLLELLLRFISTGGARKMSKELLQSKIGRYIRANIFYAPMLSHSHSQWVSPPWPRWISGRLTVHLPTRALTLSIVGFAILNYALMFSSYAEPTPYNFMFESSTLQYNKSMAVRAAYLISWKLPLIMMFACRNNILLFFHPWPLDTFNVLHRWIARITIIDVIVHSVAISIVKIEQGWYSIVWRVPYWQCGVAGTLSAGFIALQSVHWFARWNYELFLAIHFCLVITFVVCGYFHVRNLPYGRLHVLVAAAIWAADHAARLVRLALSGKIKAEVQQYPGVTVLSFDPPLPLGHIEGGSYAFVHLPIGRWGWMNAWQSHPFTLIKSNPPAGDESKSRESKLFICIRHKDGATSQVKHIAGQYAYIALDAPYGRAMPLCEFDHIAIICGGIGITAPLSYIPHLIGANRKIMLHWSISSLESMEWALPHISSMRTWGVQTYIHIKELPPVHLIKGSLSRVIYNSRLRCDECVQKVCSSATGSVAVFACGPGRMNDDVRAAVRSAILSTSVYIEYFEEAFNW